MWIWCKFNLFDIVNIEFPFLRFWCLEYELLESSKYFFWNLLKTGLVDIYVNCRPALLYHSF